MTYFLIMQAPDYVWPMDLDPAAKVADCVRMVRWQWKGGNNQPMHICTFDKASRSFVPVAINVKEHGIANPNMNARFKLDDMPRGIYNETAWERFTAQFD